MKREPIRLRPVVEGYAFRVFDIVNGFLNRCRGAWQSIFDFDRGETAMRHLQM
jgi:hypothetical protein